MTINDTNSENRRRVVVTGMGVTSSVGLSLDDLWEACMTGRSGVRKAERNTDTVPLSYAAPAVEFESHINNFGELDDSLKKTIRKGLKLMSREIQMGVASAQKALVHAGIGHKVLPESRIGVSYASDYIITTPDEVCDGMRACYHDGHFDFSQWPTDGLTKMTPIWQLKFLSNMTASHICIFNEFRGPCNAMTNREASIGPALGESVEWIRAGKADVMLVGATGSRIHPFKLIHTLTQDEIAQGDGPAEQACRPFDPNRTGTVPGEGAGALILEDEEFARKRGATIYAEVLGSSYRRGPVKFGKSNLPIGDPEHSLESNMREIMARYGVSPDEIDHVNACGYGGLNQDAAEARAIRAAFGDRADSLPITAFKGYIGNPGAGGGIIETIAEILAMQKGKRIPVLNNEKDDPACPIRPVRQWEDMTGDIFMKLAYEKFGQSAATLIRKAS